jgi:hypothetical protein
MEIGKVLASFVPGRKAFYTYVREIHEVLTEAGGRAGSSE